MVYTCEVCGKEYKTQNGIDNHMLNKHPKPKFIHNVKIYNPPKKPRKRHLPISYLFAGNLN